MVKQRPSETTSWKDKVANAIKKMFPKNKESLSKRPSLTKLKHRRTKSATFSVRDLPVVNEGSSTPLIRRHTRLPSTTNDDGDVFTEDRVVDLNATVSTQASLLDGCNATATTSSSRKMSRSFISTSSVGSVKDFLQSIGSLI